MLRDLPEDVVLMYFEGLAEDLIRSHLSPEWSFAYDRAVRRVGLCNFSKNQISVSRHFAVNATEEEFEQVVLHEIAHALAGHGAGHGEFWQFIARAIGYTGGRKTAAKMAVTAPWQGVCPAGHKHERHKRPTTTVSCGACSKKFSQEHIISWEYRGKQKR